MMRTLAPLLLALALAAPLAAAHLDNPPPRLQEFQPPRTVEMHVEDARVTTELLLARDALRHLIRHTLEPETGTFAIEYRDIASEPESAFRVVVELTRVVEYRDVNSDLLFDPNLDTLVHSWRLADGTWSAEQARRARVADVEVKVSSLHARLGSGPELDILLAAGGAAFADEGATVLPQDVALYLDLTKLPPRETGHLFAIDGLVRVAPGTSVHADVAAQNVTTAIVAQSERALAYFQWGGEAVIDGEETLIQGTLGDGVEKDGEVVHAFRLQPPIMDERARLVLVHGLEYRIEEVGLVPAPPLTLVLLVIAGALALARGPTRSG